MLNEGNNEHGKLFRRRAQVVHLKLARLLLAATVHKIAKNTILVAFFLFAWKPLDPTIVLIL